MELEQNVEICNLIDTYERLLTNKQNDVLKKYFYYNNSLSEIADELGTTRQAISDLVNRTVKSLEKYESKLHLSEKYEEIVSLCNSVLYDNLSASEKKQKLNDIIDCVEA